MGTLTILLLIDSSMEKKEVYYEDACFLGNQHFPTQDRGCKGQEMMDKS